MYQLSFTDYFFKRSKKLTKKNPQLKKELAKTFSILSQDPRYPSLKTHKVFREPEGQVLSSWVNQDIRVIWKFDKNQVKVLHILDIGGHSGANKVYK